MTYEKLGQQIGKLVDKKNTEYSNSFKKVSDILKILYPAGIKVDQMQDATLLVRILDKVVRISNGNQGDENAFNDLAGYGLIGSNNNQSGLFKKGVN